MPNLIDALLAIDDDKLLAKPTDTIEIERLSKLTGTKFALTITAIPPTRSSEISTACVEMNRSGNRIKSFDTDKMHVLTILEGVTSFDFNNAELKRRLKAATPKDVVLTLFTAGEIVTIFKAIQELSGFTDEDLEKEEKEEVKN